MPRRFRSTGYGTIKCWRCGGERAPSLVLRATDTCRCPAEVRESYRARIRVLLSDGIVWEGAETEAIRHAVRLQRTLRTPIRVESEVGEGPDDFGTLLTVMGPG